MKIQDIFKSALGRFRKQIFDKNSERYVIACEECMADNLAYAIVHGMDYEYENPEIVQGILKFMSEGADNSKTEEV